MRKPRPHGIRLSSSWMRWWSPSIPLHEHLHALPLLLVLTIVLALPSSTSSDWTSECVSRYPASCRCTWSSGKRLADCNKANMNALPVLSNDIQILDMNYNKLTQLQDNVFTQANLINLQKLYLKGCRVNRIHELAFNNLRILIEIDLSMNELEYLDPVVFATNVRLRVIKLSNNRLHTVREFPVLEYLTQVDLSHNALYNFSFQTFVGLRNLKVLDLSYNSFSNLNPELFPRLSSLNLRGNSWSCDCELKPLRDYVIAHKFSEPELLCAEPLNLNNAQWDSFDELSCKPEILHILANGKVVDSIVAITDNLVLSCVVRGDPIPDVKWVKNGRVVQEAVGSVLELERIVMMNLTVGRNDNEFVCVGSNSGGVVERNLTVTIDEAGLSGFVVLKDGSLEGGMMGGIGGGGGMGGGLLMRGDRGGAVVVYLVIAIVFLALLVGLVIGGVCVWRWGKGGGRGAHPEERDTVVKSAIKHDDEELIRRGGCDGGPGDSMRVKGTGIGGGGGADENTCVDENDERVGLHHRNRQFLNEQMPLLKPHNSADDLLDSDHRLLLSQPRPTPDLLINGSNGVNDPTILYADEEDDEDVYGNNHGTSNKFPHDDSGSVYDNYEMVYKPTTTPLLPPNNNGPDALRRLAFIRSNNGRQSPFYGHSLPRPSSVCSEPRGSGRWGVSPASLATASSSTPGTPNAGGDNAVIIPHGYVTLPRRSVHHPRNKSQASGGGGGGGGGVIKYDNLGPRTTADGSSRLSLNNIDVTQSPQQQQAMHHPVMLATDLVNPPPAPPHHYTNLHELHDNEPVYNGSSSCNPSYPFMDSSGVVMGAPPLPPLPPPPFFAPIIENPRGEDAEEEEDEEDEEMREINLGGGGGQGNRVVTDTAIDDADVAVVNKAAEPTAPQQQQPETPTKKFRPVPPPKPKKKPAAAAAAQNGGGGSGPSNEGTASDEHGGGGGIVVSDDGTEV